MKAITTEEAKVWCAVHLVPLDDSGLPSLRGAAGAIEFSIPNDAGKRIALVRSQMSNLRIELEVCVWLDDWGVWPSGQWWPILDRLRLSYGISETLSQKPAQLITSEEFDSAISVVVLAVLMLSDCYIVGASGRRYLFYSHDEYGLQSA